MELIGETPGGYSGWFTDTEGLNKDSVVYSVGVGNQIEWDLEIIRKFGCIVHTFDPTPDVIAWIATQDLPPQFIFHPYGIGGLDGNASFTLWKKPQWELAEIEIGMGSDGKNVQLPMKRLPTVMKELAHARLDILKMNVEGSEYQIIPDIQTPVEQILVQLHAPNKLMKLKRVIARLQLWIKGYTLKKKYGNNKNQLQYLFVRE